MPEEVVLISGVRTAVGKFGRAFKEMPAQQLGALVIKEAVKRAGLQMQHVEEVVMGNAISAGLGQNPARQASIYAGIPFEIGSVTVNKVCGSGLKAVILASQTIKAGDAHIIVAGGMENMSAAPHLIRSLRWGQKFGDASIIDAMVYDGLWDVYNCYHMGITGERIAQKYGITRKEADEFSLSSHQKAFHATKSGRFKEEIVPVEIHGGVIEKDEGIREDDT
ncbi:MAG: acetyl-CoA C-acyltransferase, partial [Candidatus Brocadiales bacterium]|nr:acetyl-CoA C-acyltransferase [Candidatus Brocadiales bacterium]